MLFIEEPLLTYRRFAKHESARKENESRHQLLRPALETALAGLPGLLVLRRISTEREDVADTYLFALLQRAVEVGERHVRAGQVHHHVHGMVFQGVGADLERRVRGAPAGAPRDIDLNGHGTMRHIVKPTVVN